jgi:putative N-acetyltransferase (TIGR04045 family)
VRRVFVAVGLRKLTVMLTLDRVCELSPDFAPCEFRVKWADGAWEVAEARRLRRAVFCDEQRVFEGDDLDAVDADPATRTIVALSCIGGNNEQVVGTVRIHEAAPGLWWGSRLAVRADHRQHGRLGATLIRLAVASAHARGCSVFLAHVQQQNVAMFEHLGWALLREESLHGRPHGLMRADLAVYPPCHDPLTGYVVQARSRT